MVSSTKQQQLEEICAKQDGILTDIENGTHATTAMTMGHVVKAAKYSLQACEKNLDTVVFPKRYMWEMSESGNSYRKTQPKTENTFENVYSAACDAIENANGPSEKKDQKIQRFKAFTENSEKLLSESLAGECKILGKSLAPEDLQKRNSFSFYAFSMLSRKTRRAAYLMKGVEQKNNYELKRLEM